MTVLDQWAEYMTAAGLSASTVGLRRRTIEALMRQSGVDDELLLTRAHTVTFLGRPLAKWSRLTYWRSIRAYCAFLKDFGVNAETDLLRGIPKPSAPAPVARPISDDVITKLLRAQLTPRCRAYVRLALFEGLRVHEIAKIRGEDFDLSAGWLIVCGKGGYTASIPVHPEVSALAERMPEFGLWFPSPRDPSMPVTADAVGLTIKGALASVGSSATAHQLRDTAATRMQRKVKDIRLTQSMLRHQTLSSTMKYSGVANEDLQNAVLSLDWEGSEEPISNVVPIRRSMGAAQRRAGSEPSGEHSHHGHTCPWCGGH